MTAHTCHPRLSDAKHREGRGTQAGNTVMVVGTWVPFPSRSLSLAFGRG
jgi:hypothetical protein